MFFKFSVVIFGFFFGYVGCLFFGIDEVVYELVLYC